MPEKAIQKFTVRMLLCHDLDPVQFTFMDHLKVLRTSPSVLGQLQNCTLLVGMRGSDILPMPPCQSLNGATEQIMASLEEKGTFGFDLATSDIITHRRKTVNMHLCTML